MPLNLKNAEVERLVDEVALIAGETKTEAVRKALEERRQRLRLRPKPFDRSERIRRLFTREIWPQVPEDERGRRMTQAEEDDLLGFGEDGA